MAIMPSSECRRMFHSEEFGGAVALRGGDSSVFRTKPREPRGTMARPLRIEFPGAVYHVTSRGNERRPVFFSDDDRIAFLDFLGEATKRFGWSVTVWVL